MPDKLVCGLVRLVSLLPYWARKLLARFLAALAQLAGSKAAQITAINLSIAYPAMADGERRRLALASLTETTLTLLEAPVVWTWGIEKIKSVATDFPGSYRPQDLYSEQRGAVLITPHIGSWEFLGLLMATQLNLMIVYKPHRIKCLTEITEKGRRSTGAKLATADRAGIKQMVTHIRAGGYVGLLPDQVPDRSHGIFAPFFGRRTLTTTLASSLAKHHQLPVYIGCAIRNKKGYSVYIEKMDDDFATTGTYEATSILNSRIEGFINRWPQHYNWMYKRYRHAPAGEKNPYKS